MNLHFENKVVIVTGGAKGIGEGITRLLAKEGAIPVIAGRSEIDNKKLTKELISQGLQAFQISAELTKPEECERAVNEVLAKYGRIDGLVNNAGVNDGVGLESGNYESFIASLHKNWRQSLQISLWKNG